MTTWLTGYRELSAPLPHEITDQMMQAMDPVERPHKFDEFDDARDYLRDSFFLDEDDARATGDRERLNRITQAIRKIDHAETDQDFSFMYGSLEHYIIEV